MLGLIGSFPVVSEPELQDKTSIATIDIIIFRYILVSTNMLAKINVVEREQVS